MRFVRPISVLFLVAVLSFGVAACGGDASSAGSTGSETAAAAAGNVVKVQLGENGSKYFVKVDKDTVKAGTTTFVIDNVGTMHHEMAIYKTDTDPGKLPLTAEGTVDEKKAGLLAEAVYATPLRGKEDHRIRDERGVDYTIDLKPGKYVLLCNLTGHYKAGQFVAFTVTGDAGDTAAATTEEPATSAPAADATVKGTAVGVQLGENGGKYFVKLDKDTVKAGTTTFVIDNVGTMWHEMAIYKTDTAPGKLPLNAEGTVDEEKAGLLAEAVYTTPLRGKEDHRIREERGVNYTIDLKPGKYVLLCNLTGHYKAGQFVAFTVT